MEEKNGERLSEFERTRRALKASEARFRNIVERNANGVIVVDQQRGVIRFVNPMAEALLAQTADELTGVMFGFPLGVDEITEIDLVRGTDDSIVAEMHVVKTEWEGEPAYLVSLRDITDQKRAEEALRESEKRYRLLAETAQDVICIHDMDGNITYMNRAGLSLIGCTEEESQNNTVTDFVPDTYLSTIQERAGQRQAGDRDRYRYEVEFTDATGQRVPIEVHSSPIIQGEKVTGVLLIARDITQRTRTQRKIRRLLDQQIAINRLMLELGKTLDLDKIYDIIYLRIKKLVDAWGFAVSSYDAQAGLIRAEYVVQAGQVIDASIFRPVPLAEAEQGTQSRVIHTGEPFYVPEYLDILDNVKHRYIVNEDGEFKSPPQLHRDGENLTRSALYVPMKLGGETSGVMQLQSRQPDAYTPEDIDLLSGMANVAAVAIQNGRLYSAMQRELAERRRAEDALRTSEHFLQNVFDAIQDGISVLDRDLKIVQVNRWMEKMYADAMPLIGQKCYAVYQRRSTPCPWCPSLPTFETGEMHTEIVSYPGQHSERWIELSVFPLKDAQGQVNGVIEYIKDITERRQTEEELRKHRGHLETLVAERTSELKEKVAEVERLNHALTNLLEDFQIANRRLEMTSQKLLEANHELESFAYSVSHDLRAPLRAIDGFSRILMTEYAADLQPEARRYLNNVRQGAQEMGQLIDDLLTFSRLSRKALKKQAINMTALVQEVLEDLRIDEEQRHIEIHIGNLPDCQADRNLLKQVWINLLTNAVKYTRSRDVARVKIGSRCQDDEKVYFIQDNGIGFDMQYVDKLFGVFQRLHRAEDYEGTGVGLAIVQRIVRRHGGRIWAEAEIDQGATFYFTI